MTELSFLGELFRLSSNNLFYFNSFICKAF